jgi:hypothetical protein
MENIEKYLGNLHNSKKDGRAYASKAHDMLKHHYGMGKDRYLGKARNHA